jgi:hypothetical protein
MQCPCGTYAIKTLPGGSGPFLRKISEVLIASSVPSSRLGESGVFAESSAVGDPNLGDVLCEHRPSQRRCGTKADSEQLADRQLSHVLLATSGTSF